MIHPDILLYSIVFFVALFFVFFIKSKILERYFLYETVKVFIICLFVITFLMMIDRLMELMNMILEKQLDAITIINLFALSFPFIFALSVPISVLTSSIWAFGRMSVDRELTAAKSTGINLLKMTGLLTIFMLIVTFGMAYFNDYILPETNHLLKNVIIKVTYKKPITAIKPGTFTTMNNITIYAKERIDEALYDLLIFNLDNTRFPQTIFAEKGEIFLDPVSDQLKVVLYDGEMHERDVAEAEKYQISTFEKYTFILSDLGYGEDDTSTDYRSDREMTSIQMLSLMSEKRKEIDMLNQEIETNRIALIELQTTDEPAIQSDPARSEINVESTVITRNTNEEMRRHNITLNLKQSQKSEIERQIRRFKVEMHKKYSLAAACIIFFGVGIAIGMMTQTSPVWVSFSFSTIITVIYNIFLILGEEMGSKGTMNPVLSMWLPSIFYFFVGLFLLHIARKEKRINILIITNWLKKVPKQIKNICYNKR